jgi:DNA-binding NarL/FixJ family response regulator
MVAIAVFSPDLARGNALAQALKAMPAVTVVGLAADAAALLALVDESYVAAVVMDATPRGLVLDWRGRHGAIARVALVDETDPEQGLEALRQGAAAILPRSAKPEAIVSAIAAVTSGLAVLPLTLAAQLVEQAAPAGAPEATPSTGAPLALTPRELEVLAAMANGASNKAIARALDISFHTAKFHVAAILAKLDADSRTEAVARAAQLGLVML